MDAYTIKEQIEEIDQQDKEMLYQKTDTFITNVSKILHEIRERGEWPNFVSAKYLGFQVNGIQDNFTTFILEYPRAIAQRETIDREFTPFTKYIAEKNFSPDRIFGIEYFADFCILKGFCRILELKGFECYVSHHRLIVVLEIK